MKKSASNILGELHGEVIAYPAYGDQGDQPAGGADRDELSAAAELAARIPFHARRALGGHEGRVAHCSISDVDQDVVIYRSGVEFVEAPDRVSSVITDFIEAVCSVDGARCNDRYCGTVLTSPASTAVDLGAM